MSFRDRPLYSPNLKVQIAMLITRWRMIRGLSQAALAEKIGMKQESIARAESGTHYISLRTLERIAEGLNVETDIKFTKD